MNIELKEITIRELTEGYQDNDEFGVVGYGGKLDIRPPYQREFFKQSANEWRRVGPAQFHACVACLRANVWLSW